MDVVDERIEAFHAVLPVVGVELFLLDPTIKNLPEQLAFILASSDVFEKLLMYCSRSQSVIGPICCRILIFLSFVEVLREVHHFFESTVVRINRIINLT